jgi:7-carboxy-7-deazaguanine synthase
MWLVLTSDSMYAVDPEQVRENAVKMTGEEIVEELVSLTGGRGNGLWVTLSGGNPALMHFDRAAMEYSFVAGLQRNGFHVAVETQGSVWRDWLADVDHLTVSPKPPSSGMLNPAHKVQTVRFMETASRRMDRDRRSIKIVVFDKDDLEYARTMFRTYHGWQRFLSAGTDQDAATRNFSADLLSSVARGYRWLAEAVAGDPDFNDVRVLCQLHVIAWGAARGV